jgi:cytochrome b involved in lipid metabolism
MATYINKTGANKPLVTYEELSKHTTRSDCWVAIKGRIIDVTPYLAEHPGGEDILLANAGTDASDEFNNKEGEGHTEYAFSLTEKFWIGNLDTNSEKILPKTYEKRKLYSYKEVSKHNKEEDCWIVIDDKVYDVTAFLNEHPGGPILIMDYAGNNGTQAFEAQGHSQSAKKILEKYQLGIVDKSTAGSASWDAPAKKSGSGMSPLVVGVAVALFLALFVGLYQMNN